MGVLIADEPRLLYVTGLHNAHAMETQAIQLLSRQVERLEHYPEMEAKLRAHLEESKVQRTRLEEVLHTIDEKESALKEAVLGLGGNIAALAHTTASDEIVKNTLANYMFEHFEIAAYKSLIAMSEFIGHPAGAAAARASLQEEAAMAAWIDERIGSTTTVFMERIKAGVTADH
jgi:ferritin-like metal-binding protein YciE